ncbi:MAG: type I methionyl aminopeptidase [Solirubrobacteraceae bacterium MAG38_C4-C5]|nr:type I methionyl aminopeptidase [Candidatus Siliceabacter maunaloa]
MAIKRKSPRDLEKMAAAGAILVEVHELLASMVRPGVTTKELDTAAEELIRSHRAKPTFKGYKGFPATLCTSPNAMVVHGIPGPDPLLEGDIISIDCGVTKNGWVADAAITHPVGEIGAVAAKLLEVTEASLHDAVEQCRVGRRLGDVSHAVQARVEANGLSVVQSLVGHGVGREMHEDPQIPNHGTPGTGPILAEGMVFAVEPMVTAGREAVRMGGDHWAIYAQDGSLSAHFEFTVAITADGPRILTPWHERLRVAA